MEYEEFKKILKENDLTVKKFSELANISYNTCNTWSKPNKKVSKWVKGFLRLYMEKKLTEKKLEKYQNIDINENEYQELLQLKEIISNIAKKGITNGI